MDKIDGVDKKYIHSDKIGEIQENLKKYLKPYNKNVFLQHLRINENKSLIILIIY